VVFSLSMALSETAERIVGVVEGAAGALADSYSLRDIIYPGSANPEDVPPFWQTALDLLGVSDRRVMSVAISPMVHDLGLQAVGIVRRLPEAELLKASNIGENRAAIIKALGHYADREVSITRAGIPRDRLLRALKPEAAEEYASMLRALEFM
jgi:hypothetical protein